MDIQGGQALKSKGNHVGCLALEMQQSPIVDPKRDHDPRHDEELVKGRKSAPDCSRRTFRNIQRGEHRGGADTKTGCEPADVHGGEVSGVCGAGLHDDAQNCDNSCAHKGVTSAPAVSEPWGDEASGKAASLQGRGNWTFLAHTHSLGINGTYCSERCRPWKLRQTSSIGTVWQHCQLGPGIGAWVAYSCIKGIARTPPMVPMLVTRVSDIGGVNVVETVTYSQPNSMPPKLQSWSVSPTHSRVYCLNIPSCHTETSAVLTVGGIPNSPAQTRAKTRHP